MAAMVGAGVAADMAGRLFRTSTRPMLNRQTESARLYEQSH